MMSNLPRPRTEDIVVQILGKEVLIYDLHAHKAYNLNETSAIVYQECANGLTLEELKTKHKFTDDLIYLALDELKTNNLIENYDSDYFAGLSRREVIKRVGLSTMVALPVIAGLTAPLAAHAQSVDICIPNGCIDGNAFCNGAPGCGALGFICCYVPSFNTCNCASVATCSANGGQVCA